MIRGVTVTLYERHETGRDAFNAPVYTVTPVQVENVLIGQPSGNGRDLAQEQDLHGRRLTYVLGIPKGDTHNWEEAEVELPPPFSGRFRTVGFSTVGIEDMIPLSWNRKVTVEKYG